LTEQFFQEQRISAVEVVLVEPQVPSILLLGKFFERPFTKPQCNGVWLAFCSWGMEAASEAMFCVVWSDSSSEEESITSLQNISSDFNMSICVGINCGSKTAHNSTQKMN
jgi:hypothetical protein